MIYVSVQPDINYFHWQVELYLFNFQKVGIDLDKVHVVFLYSGEKASDRVVELQRKWNKAHFFLYRDDRPDKRYIPSIKPWGMYKHFSDQSILSLINWDQIFYHDSDIIFREKIDESLFSNKEKQYMSDTVSYIGYDYCASKGIEQLKKMAEVVGISVEVIKWNQLNSGGAQYILYDVTSEYWKKVYEDSNKLYWLMDDLSKSHEGKDYPIQKWCAEMWATLWNLWYFQKTTEVHKELDFCFATAPITDFYKTKILHNAGVTDAEKNKMFFKGGAINRTPFDDDFSYVDKSYCSSMYVKNIQDFNAINH